MKAASEFSAGSRPPQVSSLSQSERWTDGDDRRGKPEREEHQGETVIQRGNTVVSRWEPRLGIKDSTLSWLPASRSPRTALLPPPRLPVLHAIPPRHTVRAGNFFARLRSAHKEETLPLAGFL